MATRLMMSLRIRAAMGMLATLLAGGAASRSVAGQDVSATLENLAKDARITATSEYSAQYRAALVADGRIPRALSRNDRGRAWAVKGETHRGGAELILEWDRPTTIGELIFFNRAAWYAEEGWKDFEVRVDGNADPTVRARLTRDAGPQRVAVDPPIEARTVTIRFTASHGGPNPGLSELLVLSAPTTDEALAAFLDAQAARNALAGIPRVDNVDSEALRRLIGNLEALHGKDYPQAKAHRARLDAILTEDRRGAGMDRLARLQREVLLFDVDRLLAIRRHEITASHVYTYHYEGFRSGGDLRVVDPFDRKDVRILAAAPEGQILDCDLSYDGRSVLFSLREREDAGYHLYTVGIDGTEPKPLTKGSWHDYNGCWLPDGGIAFLSTRVPKFAYCWHAPVGVVHRMERDGSGVHALSANYLNDFTPAVLHDGRILFSRWEYVDRPAIPIQSLWTINPDGTGLSVYFGNRVLSPGTFMEARPIPDTERILCVLTGHNGPTRGAVGVIDRRRGVNAQEAIEIVTPEVPMPAVDQGNGNTAEPKPYSSPWPLDRIRFLVSARGAVIVRTLDGTCQSLALPPPSGGMRYFGVRPVTPRSRPPVIPSALPDAAPPFARVYLANVEAGLAPHVAPGEVTRIRVVRELEKGVRIDPKYRAFGFQFPVISCGATYAGKDVLGEVPVEKDGSAYFTVPSGVPLYFMALDAQGRAVQRMRSFTHFMPGESRGCVGCHEPRRSTPPAAGARLPGRSPRALEEPEWGPGGFDYAKIVQPVLDRHCVACHHPRGAPRGLDLTGGRTDFFNVSYEVLAREAQGPRGTAFVNWIPTYNGQEWNILEVAPKTWGSPRSRLAELVLMGHPDDAGKPRVRLNDRERRRILAWIDLNVPYYGTSETAWPDREGCRRIYPGGLDAELKRVGKARCARCHEEEKIPRRVWTRITEPELNSFLLAPLAKEAGGTGRCGEAVFTDREDPDYRALLDTFDEVKRLLAENPRMDMPGGRPAPTLCRDRK